MRRSRWKLVQLGTMAVLVAVVAAACGADSESADPSGEGGITVEYLTGSWQGTECVCTLIFGEDGTYQIVQSRLVAGEDGTLRPVQNDRPVEQGDFVVDGTSLTFISNDDTVNCEPGDRLSSQVEILARICASVAAAWSRYGDKGVRVFGDAASGHIAVPHRLGRGEVTKWMPCVDTSRADRSLTDPRLTHPTGGRKGR